LIGKPGTASSGPTASAGKPIQVTLNSAQLAKIVGTEGETTGAVYKITIGRPEITMVGRVLRKRRRRGCGRRGDTRRRSAAGAEGTACANINVVAMQHYMIGTSPNVFFLHYWGRGPAQKLAAAVRAAVDQTKKRLADAPGRAPRRVVSLTGWTFR
jgi:hypothetical protein